MYLLLGNYVALLGLPPAKMPCGVNLLGLTINVKKNHASLHMITIHIAVQVKRGFQPPRLFGNFMNGLTTLGSPGPWHSENLFWRDPNALHGIYRRCSHNKWGRVPGSSLRWGGDPKGPIWDAKRDTAILIVGMQMCPLIFGRFTTRKKWGLGTNRAYVITERPFWK